MDEKSEEGRDQSVGKRRAENLPPLYGLRGEGEAGDSGGRIESVTEEKHFVERPVFEFDDSMPSGHWAVPWSDLMMVAFVLFAVLYSYVLSHRDIGEALRKPSRKTVSVSPIKDIPRVPDIPDPAPDPIKEKPSTRAAPGKTLTMEDLYEVLKASITVSNVEDVTVALDQNKTIKVSLSEPMMFDSAQADLKPASRKFLREFADRMAVTKYKISVEGHTDSFPIHSANFPTNWELSSMRAIRVARFLIEEGGLEPERFSVVGYSMYKPVVPNSSVANKARNRRVELVITREKIDE